MQTLPTVRCLAYNFYTLGISLAQDSCGMYPGKHDNISHVQKPGKGEELLCNFSIRAGVCIENKTLKEILRGRYFLLSAHGGHKLSLVLQMPFLE